MAIFFFSTEVQMNVCVCAQFGAIYLFLFDYSTLALSLPLEIANNAILLFLNEEKTSTTVRRLMLRILSIKRNTQARAHVCKFIWHCCGIGTEPNQTKVSNTAIHDMFTGVIVSINFAFVTCYTYISSSMCSIKWKLQFRNARTLHLPTILSISNLFDVH